MYNIYPIIEDTDMILNNPGMGWTAFENHAINEIDGNIVSLPGYDFPLISYMSIMVSWMDIEKKKNVYDYSKIDFLHDYWSRKGKKIILRLSTESLLWWGESEGAGIPKYVLNEIPSDQKYYRMEEGHNYWVVDVRNSYYMNRLIAFLTDLQKHIQQKEQKYAFIELRGYGLWGSFVYGFMFKSINERREAVKGIIDTWSGILSDHQLTMSCSHDPDYNIKYVENEMFYPEFERYTCLDYALTKKNIGFSRSGCGSQIRHNEVVFCKKAHQLGKNPITAEGLGYNYQNIYSDMISLHANYLYVPGTLSIGRNFVDGQKPIILKGLKEMGYRLVPKYFEVPEVLLKGNIYQIFSSWSNSAIGRAPRDYQLIISLEMNNSYVELSKEYIATSSITDIDTPFSVQLKVPDDTKNGEYDLMFELYDPTDGINIEIPINSSSRSKYFITTVLISDQ